MKRQTLLILGVLFLALLLRVYGLWQSFWLDESISAVVAKSYSHTYIWTKFVLADTHPPLYYSLLKLWGSIFGFSEVSLRVPSVIFGVVTVYLTFLIAKSVFKEKVALLASTLLATSGLAIYYSQEARMYSMTSFLVALVCLLYLREKWLAFSLALVTLAMTDYLPLTICIVFVVYHFLSKKVSDYKILIVSAFPTLLFLIAFYKVISSQSTSTLHYLQNNAWWGSVLGAASIKSLGLVWVKFLIGRIDFENIYTYAAILSAVSVVAGYPLLVSLRNYRKNLFFLLWLLIPLAVSFAGSFKIPGFSYFRLTFLLPAFYILLASGITHARFSKWFSLGMLTVSLLTSLIYLTDQKYWREDWKKLVPTIENELKGDELVVADYVEPFTPYLWYAKKHQKIVAYSKEALMEVNGVYTLDYLMDVTDPDGQMFFQMKNLGFSEKKVYNFRGTGQVRYWTRE